MSDSHLGSDSDQQRVAHLETLQVERDSGVVTIMLNRPARKNAIDATMWDELKATFRDIAVQPADRVVVIDHGTDLVAYARDVYAELRAADATGADRIVAVMPPPYGLGHAVRDRLTKAATPRFPGG